MYYHETKKTVVQELIDAKNFTIGNDNTHLEIRNTLLNNYSPVDIQKVLKQFELEGKLKIIREVKLRYDFPEEYYLEIPDISYFESLIGYEDEGLGKTNEFKLDLTLKDTSIFLNDIFLISITRFGFENYEVIKYLIENPNRKVTREELKNNIEVDGPLKDFSKIVENLKFTGDLRKVFFNVSKSSIKLINPVTKERLEEVGLKHINLTKE